MNFRIALPALALISLVGCEAFHVKTADEMKAEVRQKQITNMRNRGMSEADIDKIMIYASLPYSKQLESRISSDDTPGNNLLALMEKSHDSCQFDRSMLTLPAVTSYEISNRRHKIKTCAYDSRRVVSSYYNSTYSITKKTQDNYKKIDDIYISWQSYMDALASNGSSSLADELSIAFSSELRRYNISR